MVQFSECQSTASGQQADVEIQLSIEHQRQADENMARLRSVVSAVMFCGRQNIALRGHRNESRKGSDHNSKDANPGNFLALMNFRAEASDKFATGCFHQSLGGKQITYCGNRIQNDIIQCCGNEIPAQIVREVNASPFFTVLADEACVCSNQEQMPIVVRFIDSKHVIREEILGFALCSEGTGGRALAELIIAKWSEWGVELSRLRGQDYDGAGNMAGRLSGCAAVIAEQYPNALYIHCSSHCLNLCVVAASKITSISNMWSTLLEISIFFKYYPKRQGKLESVIKNGDNNPTVTKLVDLCKARWVARSTLLVTFEALYEYVVATFEAISTGTTADWNADSQSSAASLLRSITSFDFVVAFIITAGGMARLHSLTVSMQSSSLDIIRAYSQINSVRESIATCRSDDHQKLWFEEAVALAGKVSCVCVEGGGGGCTMFDAF